MRLLRFKSVTKTSGIQQTDVSDGWWLTPLVSNPPDKRYRVDTQLDIFLPVTHTRAILGDNPGNRAFISNASILANMDDRSDEYDFCSANIVPDTKSEDFRKQVWLLIEIETPASTRTSTRYVHMWAKNKAAWMSNLPGDGTHRRYELHRLYPGSDLSIWVGLSRWRISNEDGIVYVKDLLTSKTIHTSRYVVEPSSAPKPNEPLAPPKNSTPRRRLFQWLIDLLPRRSQSL